jgi:prepilin-type N-terminal cleavage/methylation domain-containing protein
MKNTSARLRQAGFSLVELMVSVAVLSVLASTAIPQYLGYIRRSKTLEAALNVRKIFDAAVTYHTSEHANSSGGMLARQWPAAQALTPAPGTCCLVAGQKCNPVPSWWDTATWQALRFKVADGHYYYYRFIRGVGDGSAVGDRFQAEASGDLDCDNLYSTFNRTGVVMADYSVQGGSGLYIALATE